MHFWQDYFEFKKSVAGDLLSLSKVKIEWNLCTYVENLNKSSISWSHLAPAS